MLPGTTARGLFTIPFIYPHAFFPPLDSPACVFALDTAEGTPSPRAPRILTGPGRGQSVVSPGEAVLASCSSLASRWLGLSVQFAHCPYAPGSLKQETDTQDMAHRWEHLSGTTLSVAEPPSTRARQGGTLVPVMPPAWSSPLPEGSSATTKRGEETTHSAT